MAKRRQGAARKWAMGIGIVFVLYTILAFSFSRGNQVTDAQALPALTHRTCAVQEVELNPYTLSFTLRGFSLTETNGDEFVSLDELYVEFQVHLAPQARICLQRDPSSRSLPPTSFDWPTGHSTFRTCSRHERRAIRGQAGRPSPGNNNCRW